MFNARRIKKAIAISYTAAREAIAEARESGSDFARKVALERVAHERAMIRDRRLAIRLGRPLAAHECSTQR